MFREFNVKFEDVEMLGGADNLLEGTEITKVIVRGDNNEMSSLDSMLKNCNELDTIDGELDLNGVGDIDNLLEGTELVKSINLKNINNENISANNSFPHVDRINIGGELYNKKAMQNVIASKDWTFDNINYQGAVSDNIVTKEVDIVDDNKVTIQDTLEQKATGIEIIGQTYENLVVGSGEATLLDELTLESIDGSTKEFNPHIEQPVCVETIEGETYQNLVNGKGEYKLTSSKLTLSSINLISNTDYTLQLDSTGKDDKPITVNLGGTETTIQPTNDTKKHHKVVVRTPATLSNETLELSGEGVIVNDVMLFQGGSDVIKQDVGYIDGIESIGESTLCKNLFDKFSIELFVGNLNYLTGAELENSEYMRTDYIEILPNKTYTLSGFGDSRMDLRYTLYNDNKSFNKGAVLPSYPTTTSFTFTTDSNSKYLKIAYKCSNMDTLQLEEGVVATDYQEYFEGERYKIDILTHNGEEKNCFTYDLFEKSTVSGSAGWSIFDLGLNMNGSFKLTVKNNSGYDALRIKIADTPSEISVNSGYQSSYSGNLKGKLCIAAYWNTTGIFVGNGMGKTELSSLIKEGKLKITIDSDDTNLNYYYEKETTQSILLPQPLNKIGDIKDKFYWDDNKGHYCIEEKTIEIVLNGSEHWLIQSTLCTDVCFLAYLKIFDSSFNMRLDYINNKFPKLGFNYSEKKDVEGFYTSWGGLYLNIFNDRLPSISIEGFKQWLSENPIVVLCALQEPNIIDLPHLNKKYSLDTYIPTTYLECTNSPIQPSRMLLESDTVRYKPSALETDTDYTIQFECKEKSDKKVKLNLGGTEKEVDIEVGLNHVSITTPSELSKDRLFLSGAGNKVSDVIVAKGEMNQYPKYFNGVQSTGELQDDGTYKIEVSTENEFKNTNLWDGKKVSDYVTDFIEIYDNTFSLNSYDAYITEYDADRQLVTREYMTSTANKMLTAKNSNCKYITVRSNIFKETDPYYVKEGLLVLSNRMVSFKEKPTGFRNSLKVLISSNSPLAKGDKLYWNKSNKRYEIDRNGVIEVPVVEGDVIDLPRLYQRDGTNINISTGNIKPAKTKIVYKDII